jgi:hypothetical protein
MTERASDESIRINVYTHTLTKFTDIIKHWNDDYLEDSQASDGEIPSIEFRSKVLILGLNDFFEMYSLIVNKELFISGLTQTEKSVLKSNIGFFIVTVQNYPKLFEDMNIPKLYIGELAQLQNLL